MATTPNKGYEQQVTGTNPDLWGIVLNTEVFAIIDNNMGGTVPKTLSNVTVNLTADESEQLRLVLNGALTGDVLVTTLCNGFTLVENNCTGAFNVSFQRLGVGTPVVLPNGTANLVGTGLGLSNKTFGQDFPAGTRIPFQQTTPPPGWSKEAGAAYNNVGLRLVTGGIVNGGTVDFTTAFSSRVLGGAVQQMTLDITQIPSHGHGYNSPDGVIGRQNGGATGPASTPGVTDSAGGGQPHNHGLTLNNLDMSVKFIDFVVGIKQ